MTAIGPDGDPLRICCARHDVNLFAPGFEVPTLGLHGYTTASGSSTATVIAAGLIALRLSHTMHCIDNKVSAGAL